MARACHEDHIEITRSDDAIEVHVEEVQPWRRAPMPKQARLDMLYFERLAQQRIVEQIDLPDREIVRRAPPGVYQCKLGGRRSGHAGLVWLGDSRTGDTWASSLSAKRTTFPGGFSRHHVALDPREVTHV